MIFRPKQKQKTWYLESFRPKQTFNLLFRVIQTKKRQHTVWSYLQKKTLTFCLELLFAMNGIIYITQFYLNTLCNSKPEFPSEEFYFIIWHFNLMNVFH